MFIRTSLPWMEGKGWQAGTQNKVAEESWLARGRSPQQEGLTGFSDCGAGFASGTGN